jgi:molecular chaperone HscB
MTAQQNHFDRLGLPRRFALDSAELERRYLASSRAIHPDYHAGGSTAGLAASLDLSAALNEAYNTLKDPFARAEYLLTLEGGPSASDHKQMPHAFLAEMLDLREQIEEARAAGQTDRLAVEFAGREAALREEITQLFATYAEQADEFGRMSLLREVRARLNAVKYIRRLTADLTAD